MKIAYDAEADVLMIYLREGKYSESDQVTPYVIVSFDEDEIPLSIEILEARRILGTDGLTKLELPFQLSAAK